MLRGNVRASALVIVAAAACAPLSQSVARDAQPATNIVRLLVLGEANCRPGEGMAWPALLQQQHTNWALHVLAEPWYSTGPDGRPREEERTIAYTLRTLTNDLAGLAPFDAVLVILGTVDARKDWAERCDEFVIEGQLNRLLERLAEHPATSNALHILGTPFPLIQHRLQGSPYEADYPAGEATCDAISAVVQKVAARRGLPLIDLHLAVKQCKGRDGIPGEPMGHAGVRLDAAGHRWFADYIAPRLALLVEGPNRPDRTPVATWQAPAATRR